MPEARPRDLPSRSEESRSARGIGSVSSLSSTVRAGTTRRLSRPSPHYFAQGRSLVTDRPSIDAVTQAGYSPSAVLRPTRQVQDTLRRRQLNRFKPWRCFPRKHIEQRQSARYGLSSAVAMSPRRGIPEDNLKMMSSRLVSAVVVVVSVVSVVVSLMVVVGLGRPLVVARERDCGRRGPAGVVETVPTATTGVAAAPTLQPARPRRSPNRAESTIP